MRTNRALLLAGVAVSVAVLGYHFLTARGVPAPGRPPTPPVTPFAAKFLNAALDRAAGESDPHDSLLNIVDAARLLPPNQATDVAGRVADFLDKKLVPPGRRSVNAALAALVAPHDRGLRDKYLTHAVEEGKRALQNDALWKAREVPRGSIPFVDPRRQRDEEKQLLAFDVRLWEAVPSGGEAARGRLTRLFADAKVRGSLGGVSPTTFGTFVGEHCVWLDPELFLTVAAKTDKKADLAEFCYQEAYRRHLDTYPDAFTRTLITYAVANGAADGGRNAREALNILGEYDLSAAWAKARALPAPDGDTRGDRSGALGDLIGIWAWQAPDAALAAAEKESDEDTRRDLVDKVAWVWASKKPEAIERAVKNLDNEVRQEWSRKRAEEELAWRRAGNPPRDTRQTAPRKARPRFTSTGRLTEEEKAARRAARGPIDPEEVRVLENPGDTGWLRGGKRQQVLQQAASRSYFETHELTGLNQILGGLKDPVEIDMVLRFNVEMLAASDPAIALDALKRIKAPNFFVSAACSAARGLAEASLRVGE